MDALPRIVFVHRLRGLAALIVMLHHYLSFLYAIPEGVQRAINMPPAVPQDHPTVILLQQLQNQLEHFALDFRMWGHIGVGLFFLVSGFVIPFSLLQVRERGFLLGRFIRLWPTYAAALATVLLMLSIASYDADSPLPFTFGSIIRHLLLIEDATNGATLDLVSWSLAAEVVFYLFIALAAPLLRSGTPMPMITLAFVPVALATVLPLFVWNDQGLVLLGLARYLSFLPYMLIGVMANFYYRNQLRLGLLVGYSAVLFFLFVGSRSLINLGQPRLIDTACAYFYALLLFGLAYGVRDWLAALPNPLARACDVLADISYPLYIIHAIHGYVVINLLSKYGVAQDVAMLEAMIWSGFIAYALHSHIERPTHRWARRLVLRYPLLRPARRLSPS